ncbi:chromosome partitioning protein [Methylomonas sp. Kb3]|uniref:ParA family protein n=1 Tax=Methylomonas sp. Kb3 TaxID=1611544 RepID=UPI000C336D48|nr:AAA family ATPase [Methylomonas sp. Kb3]PKD40453.1 chromosome partitioning protein [Methylomonas sp. Kb3]
MKSVSFVNMKGGVAKTTMAVNVADCLATRHDMRVLVVDIDPQFNATQCVVSGEDYKEHLDNQRHTVVDIFDDSPRPVVGVVAGADTKEPLSVEEIEPLKIKDNFDLLPGALELYRLDMTGGQGRENRLKIYIEHLKEKFEYDVVIIDTPPTPSAWMSSALIASDYYLVPVKPEPLSATGIDLLRSVISRVTKNYGLKLSCAGVVLTIAEENTKVFKGAKHFIDNNNYWKGKRYAQHLLKRTEVARQQGEQGLILDTNDRELKLALSKIVVEFLDRIGLES